MKWKENTRIKLLNMNKENAGGTDMLLETERLIIRNVEPDDGKSFAQMALDGSLNDIGFTKDCGEWMAG